MKTTCIVAAYNEAPRIGKVLDSLTNMKILDEIIIVDDGSTDGTSEIVRQYETVTLIRYDDNRGKGFALYKGLKKARNDLIILVDADLCGLKEEHFAQLIDTVIGGDDLALGTFVNGGDNGTQFKDLGPLKELGPLIWILISGFRCFRKSDFKAIEKIRESKYGVDIIITNDFIKRNKRIKLIKIQNVKHFLKYQKLSSKEALEQYLAAYKHIVKGIITHSPIPGTEDLKEMAEDLQDKKKDWFKILLKMNRTQNRDKAFDFIDAEAKRQIEGLELIPSENYVSEAVLEALGSILTNKYSEGYPKKRYYGGNKWIDEVELLAQKRALQVFGLDDKEWGVNVQPYSGSPANQAVYLALLEPGDTVMGLSLPSGGHLTHGWKVNFSAQFYNSVQYDVTPEGDFDFEEIRKLALKHKPKLIWAGATAYSRNYDYSKFAEIAKEVGACFAADIAHVAGLIVADVHNSPFPYADVVTTTTHKTLRGPRGAMIFAKGELIEKINRAVFPGLQGGPHNHQTAAIAVSLGEALRPEFKNYGAQIVKNAKALADGLKKKGIKIVGGGTENHLMLLDFSDFGGGRQVELALEYANITANKNTIPNDPNPPYYPSGVRIGTPALTSRGMLEEDMEKIAEWIVRVVEIVKDYKLPEEKEERRVLMRKLKKILPENEMLLEIKKEVAEFASQFPVPGITE